MAGNNKNIEATEFMEDEQELLLDSKAGKEGAEGPEVQEEHFKQNIISDNNDVVTENNFASTNRDDDKSYAQKQSDLEEVSLANSEPLENIVISELVENYESDQAQPEDSNEKQSGSENLADNVQNQNDGILELEEELLQQTIFQSQDDNSIPTLDNPVDESPFANSLDTDENYAPIASSSDQIVDEDNVYQGQLNATDQDYADSLTYSLVTNVSQGSITIDEDGSYTFNPGDAFESLAEGETQQVTFTYQVQDKNGATDTQEITITIEGSNDGPEVVELSGSAITENDSGAVVGEITTSDVDANDSHIYSVSDSRFEVTENANGEMQLKLKDGVSLDYESESSVTVSVTSTDTSGMSISNEFTVNVNNVDEFNYITGTDNAEYLRGTSDNDHITAMDGNDRVYAGEGDDVVLGGAGNDVLLGQGGNDTIYGGEGNDQLHGQGGDNTLDGGDGDDRLYGHTGGSDQLSGGAGNDYIYADGNDTVDGGEGTDRVYTYGEDDVSLNMGEASVESVYAQSNADHEIDASSSDAGVTVSLRGGDDEVTGSDHNDNISTGDGDDHIEGGAGNDSINAGAGDDVIEGGAGNDSLNAGAGNNVVDGGDGDDRLYGHTGGSDQLSGGAGNDYIYADGNDTVDGGEGTDRVYTYGEDDVSLNMGEASVESVYAQSNADHNIDASSSDAGVTVSLRAGDDVVTGSDHNDSLNAGAGNNVVDGGDGDDRIYGHTGGSDELRGGAGNDYIYADGNDTVDGGEGTDRVYTYGEDDVSLNMGEASVESVYAQSNADHNIDASTSDAGVTVSLRAGDDVVTGSDHNDNINTGDGDDVIEGGDGNDRINAGAGDDVIEGGDGNDSINGGDGNDIFLFEGNSGSDSVNGGSGEGWLDTIDLSNSVGGETEVSSPWQIEINGEEVDFDIDAGSLELGVDVSGIIQFDDGSQISFDNIETIEW